MLCWPHSKRMMPMLDFAPGIGSLLTFGSTGPASKKAINELGRHRAIAYAYISLVAVLIIGALAMGINAPFPQELLPLFILQVVIGAFGSIAAYKAMEYGRASVVVPVGMISGVLVIALSIMLLGESPGALQVAGGLMIICSALVVAADAGGRLRFEPWMPYLAASILCRTYYFTGIKTFVTALGPYQSSLFIEAGIAAFIIGFHLLRGRDLSPPKRASMLAPAAATGTLMFFGSVLYNFSVRSIGAGLTSAIYSGTPIVNAVLAYFLLGEKLDAAKYAAIALMVLGLVMIVM
jgi:drug/metabolite transporter (DMT)-like permease